MQGTTDGIAAERRPWGFVGMLALVWCVEASLDHHRRSFQDMASVSWEQSGRAAVRKARKNSVLIFGDSLLKFGIHPEVFRTHTGKSSYNLCVNSGNPATSYLLLRRVVEKGARPSAVLIDFEPNIAAHDPFIDPNLWAELVTPLECLRLAWTMGDASFFGRTTTARMLSSLRYRFPLRARVSARLEGVEPSKAGLAGSLAVHAEANRGSILVPHADRPSIAVDTSNPVFFPRGWHCSRLNGHFVKRFFELAASRDVPVFWVMTPYTRTIQAHRERLGQDADFTQFAESVRRRFPNVTIIDCRRLELDEDQFWDGTVHLDERGASSLTSLIAMGLQRSIGTTRRAPWVVLPERVARNESSDARRVEE
jgi:hypothetical protein